MIIFVVVVAVIVVMILAEKCESNVCVSMHKNFRDYATCLTDFDRAYEPNDRISNLFKLRFYAS